MIRVCYYKGCGVVYGEKEPLSDKSITHGLCPKHLKIYQEEIKTEMKKEFHGQQGKPVSKYSISCEKIQEKTSLTFLAILDKMMS